MTHSSFEQPSPVDHSLSYYSESSSKLLIAYLPSSPQLYELLAVSLTLYLSNLKFLTFSKSAAASSAYFFCLVLTASAYSILIFFSASSASAAAFAFAF